MGFNRATTGSYPRALSMAAARSLPAAVDLSNAGLPVGNQGQQGSCVAWTVAYYMKTLQEAKEHKWDVSEASRRFSPAFVYNQVNGGRDAGATFPEAFEALSLLGDVDLVEFPYNQYDYRTQPVAAQLEAAKPYRIFNYNWIWRGAGGNNVNEIKARLAAGDPVAIGIPVYQAFYFNRGNWVDSPAPGETFYGNHAITAVGYDDRAGGGRGGIKIVNSWGSEWGAGGYAYLSYKFISDYCWEAWSMKDRASDTPRISKLSPGSGSIGAEIAISGDNFGALRGASSVKFGGQNATVTHWSNSTIKARVPAVGDSQVSVYNWIGQASNGKPFDVDLSLTGAAPGVAKPGDEVILDGAGLGTGGELKFDETELKVLSWSDSEIRFRAPDRLGSGSLRAFGEGKVSNAVPFSVVASTWYLAEGCTAGGFETWILVQNPNKSTATVNITYMTPEGNVAGPTVTLPPDTRQTFNVADTVPGAWQVSARVTADRPVIAERSMYGGGRAWGTESVGVESPSLTWYLAEGATDGGFETWVLVQNPNSCRTDVTITYMTPKGRMEGPRVTLEPNSRQTFNVAEAVPGEWQVSTRVDADRPVIAERAVYWNSRGGGHNSVGVTEPSKSWYLAEGSTGEGFETWVLVMNPGDRDAKVTLTYMTERGQVNGPVATVKAGTRMSFSVADTLSNNWSVSTKVTGDQPIIAERAVYWNSRIEGSESVAVKSAARTWFLAEGSTGESFETWVLVQNPNDRPADVNITYMTPEGERQGPAVTLPANSRKSFYVADSVPNQWQVSTRVTADSPVIAERSMYGNGRRWGHGSAGSPQ
jgi:nitrogen fixation protein FixH